MAIQRPGGDFTPVTGDTVLSVGDRVRTGPDGYAAITYFDGSTTSLQPDTEIRLDGLDKLPGGGASISFRQEIGLTWNRVERLVDANSRFETTAASTVAFVRGTEYTFRVTATQEVIVEAVTDSVVVETTIDGVLYSVTLEPGFQTTLQPNQPPTAPIRTPLARLSFRVEVEGPVGLYLTDDRNRSVGFQPEVDVYTSQVPGATFTVGGGRQGVHVPDPVRAYELRLTGRGEGRFTVTFTSLVEGQEIASRARGLARPLPALAITDTISPRQMRGGTLTIGFDPFGLRFSQLNPTDQVPGRAAYPQEQASGARPAGTGGTATATAIAPTGPTATATGTAFATTPTQSATATATAPITLTVTPAVTATATATLPTGTGTPTSAPTGTPTSLPPGFDPQPPTASSTPTAPAAPTPSATPTPADTATPTVTETPTITPAATETATAGPIPGLTPPTTGPIPGVTPPTQGVSTPFLPSATPPPSATPTARPTDTALPTATSSPLPAAALTIVVRPAIGGGAQPTPTAEPPGAGVPTRLVAAAASGLSSSIVRVTFNGPVFSNPDGSGRLVEGDFGVNDASAPGLTVIAASHRLGETEATLILSRQASPGSTTVWTKPNEVFDPQGRAVADTPVTVGAGPCRCGLSAHRSWLRCCWD